MMNHKQKVKLAKKLRSSKEEQLGISIWMSQRWRERNEAKRRKQIRQKKNKTT